MEGQPRLLGSEAEVGKQRGLVLGVLDVEAHEAVERPRRGVVEHHPQRGAIPFAQEAGQVGTDHEVFDGARLAVVGAGAEVTGQAVHPEAPRGDRVGNGELDRGAAVARGHQVRLPERGLREVGAGDHLRRGRRCGLGGAQVGKGAEPRGGFQERCFGGHPERLGHRLRRRLRCRLRVGQSSLQAIDQPQAKAADADVLDVDRLVRPQLRTLREVVEVRAADEAGVA